MCRWGLADSRDGCASRADCVQPKVVKSKVSLQLRLCISCFTFFSCSIVLYAYTCCSHLLRKKKPRSQSGGASRLTSTSDSLQRSVSPRDQDGVSSPDPLGSSTEQQEGARVASTHVAAAPTQCKDSPLSTTGASPAPVAAAADWMIKSSVREEHVPTADSDTQTDVSLIDVSDHTFAKVNEILHQLEHEEAVNSLPRISDPIYDTSSDYRRFDPDSRDVANYFFHTAPDQGMAMQDFKCWGCEADIVGKHW